MKWLNLFGTYKPSLKQDPLSASVLPSVVSGIGSLGSSMIGLSSQRAENEKNRNFTEYMWRQQNLYNSPQNQRKLLEDAGYSPYLFNEVSPSSTADSAPSPSTAPLPTFQNPMNGASMLLQQGLQVESNIEMQRVKSLDTLADIMIKLYKDGGQSQVDDFMKEFAPMFKALNFSGSHAESYFNEFMKDELSKRYNMDMDSLNKELQYSLGKKFTPQQIQASLEETQYRISEIVGRLNSMRIENKALMDRTAAEVVRAVADAYKLRKEGDKYLADAKTANLLRDEVHKIIKHEAAIKGNQARESDAVIGSKSSLFEYMQSDEARERVRNAYDIDMDLRSSELIRAFDKMFGEYIKASVSYSGSSSTSQSYNESYIFHP